VTPLVIGLPVVSRAEAVSVVVEPEATLSGLGEIEALAKVCVVLVTPVLQ
jgi:hypothetical protein